MNYLFKRFPFFVSIVLSFLSIAYAAAQGRQYQLNGFMGVQGGEVFSYVLSLSDSSENMLTGFAYTYLQKNNEVKAAVTVYIDRKEKTITLKETHIIVNNGFKSKALICLIDAQLRYIPAEKTLSGPLNTHTSGNDALCSKGSITFNHPEEIAKLFDPVAEEIKEKPATATAKPKPKPVRIIVDSTLPARQPVATKAEPKQVSITEGRDKTYDWRSDEIIMEIWDDNTVDNDRISVFYNGNIILENYTLTSEKKKLHLPVGGNELNIIRIAANNEGNDPPNTATILLTDAGTQHVVVAHNKVGKSALIKIRSVK